MIRRTQLAVLLLLIVLSPGCERKPDASLVEGHNVLFVTLDTTRADRIGCYGYRSAETPALDKLAVRGTLFEQAFAQVPLTLPSHASMMTGRYPREHGVRDNGENALGTSDPTLAEIFKAHGYRTAGFVSSFVLDSQFGINRGFEEFNDDMGEHAAGGNPLSWQISGDVITDRALKWLNTESDKPFFCWVHYYDAHDPHDAPEGFDKPGRGPYDSEIAFVDSQLQRLLDWLAAKRLKERTLVVVVADHGESLGEHGEVGHTNFLYNTHVQVPMVFAHPAAIPRRKRVSTVVENIDVFWTILDVFGWEPPDGLISRSLAGVFVGAELDERSAYHETLYALNSFGWAEQRALTTARWKYISSTKPELYDRKRDPLETKNLHSSRPDEAASMLRMLRDRFDEMPVGEAVDVDLSVEARRQLVALGYLGGSSALKDTEEVFLTEGLIDPKDMIEVLKRFRMATHLMGEAEGPEDFRLAVPLLRHVVLQSPETVKFQTTLAAGLMAADMLDEALVPLRAALQLDRANAQTLVQMGEALFELGRVDESFQHFEASLEIDDESPDLHVRYAKRLQEAGRNDEAIMHCQIAIDLGPKMKRAYAQLCTLLEDPAELETATQRLAELVAEDPTDPADHFNLGLAYLRLKRAPDAIAEFRTAIEQEPLYGEAIVNLASALADQRDLDGAKVWFRKAIELDGFEANGYHGLGVVARREKKLSEAIGYYEKAVVADPAFAPAMDELPVLYVGQRRFADAIRVLQLGYKADPQHVPTLNALGQLLATCQDDAVRDGATAVRVLEHAAKLTAQRDPMILANLGAAYAEIGSFDEATAVAKRGLLLLSQIDGQDRLISKIRGQIELFKLKKPFHDPGL